MTPLGGEQDESARLAGDNDLAELVRLGEQALAALPVERGADVVALRELRRPPVAPSLRSALHDPDAAVVLGSWAGVPVGYAVAHLEVLADGSTLAVVEDLWVEPDARGVGVGEAVFDELIAWARGRGCRGIDALVLPGDRQTKNFFERYGLVARAILVHRSFLRAEEAEVVR